MAFKITKRENRKFDSPQEMYADYRSRTINAPLDYQSEMIDLYMREAFVKKDVAIELPTGSGKTLIGLLIGEYRRRKNKEKILYVCPTKQLVYQVAEQAENKYGINVSVFVGKIKDYDPKEKVKYTRTDIIAITNYSSLFNNSTFFETPDIIILDDAHSSEDYISSFWSLDISRSKFRNLYDTLLENFKDLIEITHYNRMKQNDPIIEEKEYVDKIPNIKLLSNLEEIISIIDENVKENNLKYSWVNIKNHLKACNIYISWNKILIRPIIPPALTHKPFSQAKQRIYMSATLGESGELERILGIEIIKRLPIVKNWNEKSLGRKFFMFPDASFSKERVEEEVFLKINSMVDRMLVLVPDNPYAQKIINLIEEKTSTKVFSGKDIELSKVSFTTNNNAIAVLANRFDGIDLSGDECRMLVIAGLPKSTHLQEKFLTTRMAASILFCERIKTRIVQAIGRCTRTPVDYSAVCIIGEKIMNELINPKKLEEYHVELQAEIDFGYQQSVDYESVEEFLDNLRLFLKRDDEWTRAEEAILNLRDEKISNLSENKSKLNVLYNKLLEASKFEVRYQYAIWKNDYEKAYQCIEEIIKYLNAPSLRGYYGFWNYIGGYIAYLLYNEGKNSYFNVSKNCLINASNSTNSIMWFNKLIPDNKIEISNSNDIYLSCIIPRIEKQILKDGLRNNNKFDKRINTITKLLRSNDGNEFERGHLELGSLLGYISDNTNEEAGPDPWWIINNDICIVSEDKIYKEKYNPIPVKHVRQTASHINWIKGKIPHLSRDVKIITIMITNSIYIEKAAVVHGKEVWYVNREEFLNWSLNAIEAIRKLRRNFSEEGDSEWRYEAENILKEMKVTPKDYVDFITIKKLNLLEIPKK